MRQLFDGWNGDPAATACTMGRTRDGCWHQRQLLQSREQRRVPPPVSELPSSSSVSCCPNLATTRRICSSVTQKSCINTKWRTPARAQPAATGAAVGPPANAGAERNVRAGCGSNLSWTAQTATRHALSTIACLHAPTRGVGVRKKRVQVIWCRNAHIPRRRAVRAEDSRRHCVQDVDGCAIKRRTCRKSATKTIWARVKYDLGATAARLRIRITAAVPAPPAQVVATRCAGSRAAKAAASRSAAPTTPGPSACLSTSSAVAGPKHKPEPSWPAATNSPGQPSTGPMMGSPPTAYGRSPTRADGSSALTPASAGRKLAARCRMAATMSRSRSVDQPLNSLELPAPAGARRRGGAGAGNLGCPTPRRPSPGAALW